MAQDRDTSNDRANDGKTVVQCAFRKGEFTWEGEGHCQSDCCKLHRGIVLRKVVWLPIEQIRHTRARAIKFFFSNRSRQTVHVLAEP